MRIFYFITKSEIGGAQVHVRDLMKYMIRNGHTVALMSYPGGWLEEEAKILGVKIYHNTNFSNSFNPLNAFNAIRKIQKAVKDFSPDLLALHSSGAGFLVRIAIQKKIPTIFTAHSFAFTDGAPLIRKIIAIIAERIVGKYTNKIICVSDFDRKLALKYGIVPHHILIPVHNGVILESLVERKEREIKKIRIISVGRFAYPKKYNLLLESYSLLPKEILQQSELFVVGKGPDEDILRQEVATLGIQNSVTFITNAIHQEIFPMFLKADIFVLLSKHEGLPMTILEAMSAGLPIIASNVGGIPEEIDSSCGILVENNKEDICKALTLLIKDSQVRLSLGASARVKTEKLFSLERFLLETKNVYEDVLRLD